MKQVTKLQTGIIVGSMIGAVINMYSLKESAKPVNTLKKRIRQMMLKRSKSNPKEFEEAIKIADTIWRDAINEFEARKIKIVTSTTVLNFYTYYENELKKYVGITEKNIESFLLWSGYSTVELEATSYEVTDYILDKLEPYTSIKRKSLKEKLNN